MNHIETTGEEEMTLETEQLLTKTSERETSGATTALIIRYVRAHLGEAGVKRVLDIAGVDRSVAELEDESGWFSYDQKVALFDAAAHVLDDPDVARHIGSTVLEHRVGLTLKVLLKMLGTPGQVLRNIARAAPKFSTVCTMTAPEVSESSAVVTYRLHEGHEPSHYDCDYNIGLLSQVSVLFGLPPAAVSHDRCQVAGDEECVYEIRWRRPRRLGRKSAGSRERELEQELETLGERYEALQSAVGDLVSADDLDTVLGRIATRAAQSVRVEAHVLAVTPGDGWERRIYHEGIEEDLARGLADAACHPGALADTGALVVEIASARRRYGHLIALYSAPHPFFEEERRLLETFAHHAAAALDAATALHKARAAERETRRLFDGIPVALYRVAVDGTILDANPAMADVLGTKDVSSLRGRSAFDFYVDKREGYVFREMMRSSDIVRAAEAILRTDDGRIISIRDTARAVRDERGEVVYFEGAIEDTTEEKAAHEERERLERQLLQAQRLDAIGRLAGGIAHDFNNLLAVIGNFADFLIDDLDENDERRGDAQEIRKAADRGARLVKQLLAFSRKHDTSPRIVDLNSLVVETEKLLHRTLGEDISLEVRTDPDLMCAEVDPGHVEQIVLNLAVNARDAMPDGGSLVIETANERVVGDAADGVPDALYVRLSISDTGCGMTEEVKAQMFEPFFTTKDRGAGSGLGLAMVYGLVKQAGGYITVESEPQCGTTITVCLPATTQEVAPDEAAPVMDGSRTGEVVLLVEDEGAVRDLTGRILRQAGYSVISAASGEEALAHPAARSGEFDVLLTDVIMPRMSGRELFDRLNDRGLEFKTVFMSGYTDQIIARHGIEEQGCEFLPKPFSAETVVATLRKALSASVPG